MSTNAAEVAVQISKQTEGRVDMFREMKVSQQCDVFGRLLPAIQRSIIEQLSINEVVDLLDHMDMQEAEQALSKIADANKRSKIVKRLKGAVKEKLEYFLRFHPKASLDLITFNYIFLSEEKTVEYAADMVDRHYDETGRYPEILVHRNGDLIGEVPMPAMIKAKSTDELKTLVKPVDTLQYHADIEDVIEELVTEDDRKIVILDHDTSVLGVVYADAARQLFSNLPVETLYGFAGVDNSERPFDSVGKKVNSRYRWLILNLATTFLASSVLLLFQSTLDALTILTIYIPVIAGMGGNAATQSFAIMVRGLTVGTISLKNSAPAIFKEALAGLFNGIIIGAIVAVVSAIWHQDEPIMLGIVVAFALIGVHVAAGVAGALIPLVLKQMGRDPAAASTIFITTVTDVLGLVFLLGFATLILL